MAFQYRSHCRKIPVCALDGEKSVAVGVDHWCQFAVEALVHVVAVETDGLAGKTYLGRYLGVDHGRVLGHGGYGCGGGEREQYVA